MASSDSESDLFPVYLQRHSRQTRSKDIDPLASGTGSAFRAKERVRPTVDGEKARADVAKTENSVVVSFMVVGGRLKFRANQS
mmetsp:Transcript_27954/g.34002  ORF Transcript_27954/g.34002 Transcript_27954/m.34002 type:complete len:83 (-) Transcript_27954:8-256(-)